MKCLSSIMKLMTTMTLIVSISGFTHAHSAVSEEVGHQERSGSKGATDLFKFEAMKFGASEEIAQLARNMCSQYYRDATKVAKNIEEVLVDYLQAHENIDNPSPKQIILFLNKHKNQMLCGDTNYMVESLRHGAYDELFNILFYEKLLVEDEDLYVDINAISYTGPPTGNKPETVLDYMYREVANPILPKKAKGEIQYLIEMFEEYFNGKRYSELTDAEKAAATRFGN
ncbi:MAG: hypothetical protein WA981_14545 [Glaciecola sp.]